MPANKQFQTTFVHLKRILRAHENQLTVTTNKFDNYMLDAGYSEKFGRKVFFGGVSVKKRYVSFYLMPVYAFPDLLKGISPALNKRMQGKACFNFTVADGSLFKELAELAEKSFARYKRENLVGGKARRA